MAFILTPKQKEANKLLGGAARHIMLAGGSRSGKTALICRAIATRAIKAPKSRHLITRLHFNACKTSIGLDTMPKVLSLAFPGVRAPLNKSDFFFDFPNGSQIWLGGLDDKDRTEKILGTEYASIYLNEASQITYDSRNLAMTRLAQNAEQLTSNGASPLIPRSYTDLNPRTRAHWTYRLFVEKMEPTSRSPLANPELYAWMRINPIDNVANLPAGYLQELENLPARMRKRFLEGEFIADNPGALWTLEMIDASRLYQLPAGVDLVRIVVAVDPSVKDTGTEAGIVVVGLGTDGRGYVLRDETMSGRPSAWAAKAIQMWKEYQADRIVAEINNGGQLIEEVILAQEPGIPVTNVTASRGKITRAEPISALYERGLVSHVGSFPDLEDEMTTYTPPLDGAPAQPSPNRMDALVWGLTYLMQHQVASLDDFRVGGVMLSAQEMIAAQVQTREQAQAAQQEMVTDPDDDGGFMYEELNSARAHGVF